MRKNCNKTKAVFFLWRVFVPLPFRPNQAQRHPKITHLLLLLHTQTVSIPPVSSFLHLHDQFSLACSLSSPSPHHQHQQQRLRGQVQFFGSAGRDESMLKFNNYDTINTILAVVYLIIVIFGRKRRF